MKEFGQDRFMGVGFSNWTDNFKDLLLEWAEDQKDDCTGANAVDLQGDLNEAENWDLHTYLMLHTVEGPKVSVKACNENGLDAWRRLCNGLDAWRRLKRGSASEVT